MFQATRDAALKSIRWEQKYMEYIEAWKYSEVRISEWLESIR